MGEVYRADDLKLGQPVALKLLPKALADDSVRRERLFAEVRIARQVSHPNICRVFDISELEGRHFLTMEYIDGEDLASLLKRIGSLHGAKALDVARQLCAGLAAAHDKGVLHRDLKPANVMIDGRGRVRIADFGLAVAAGEDVPEADVSGTPPYMAPEQFAGKGASVRSDIYALGLIFMLRALFRNTWAAAGIPTLIALLLFLGTMPIMDSILFTLLFGGLFIVFLRFGLLALVAYVSFFVFSTTFPIAAPLSAWYSGIGLAGLALLLALALYAFHTSLGGQPMFGRASLED
jgi:serine/threonine protein kinase